MAQFLLTDFLGLPTLGSITSDISSTILQILVPILLQISWIFQNTPNFYNLMIFKGVIDKKPKKSVIRKYTILSKPWNLTFFEEGIFQLFSCYMVRKYQNEISPIFYYGKKLETSGKTLKIPYLQPPDWGQPYWMTRYIWSSPAYPWVSVWSTLGLNRPAGRRHWLLGPELGLDWLVSSHQPPATSQHQQY